MCGVAVATCSCATRSRSFRQSDAARALAKKILFPSPQDWDTIATVVAGISIECFYEVFRLNHKG